MSVDPESRTLIADSPFSAPMTSVEVALPEGDFEVLANRYELVALLGAGGMGAVYRARDRELGDFVALKMLRHELANVPEALARFRQEVKLARKVTSPNVARTFDIGEHAGDRFLTMELVDGESLAGLVAREGRLTTTRTLELAVHVANGLAAAHDVGVIHRDLKPENVLIGRDGSVKVTDFGIAVAHADAAALAPRALIGTPAYMAPEQVLAELDIDARADVYAFGVMLYEMFTGQVPWTGENLLAVASARLVRPPPDPRAARPQLEDSIAELVLACMARERAERPANGRAVLDSLLALGPSTRSNPRLSGRAPFALETRSTGLRTIAVLPLANEGPTEDDYIACGITEELIDGLSLSASLRVQSAGAVKKYAALDRDPRDVGQELGVQAIVTGSVRRQGETLRVALRMSSVADGFQLWSRRVERPAADVLAIAQEATAAIASAIAVNPVDTRRSVFVKPEALELYLRARHDYHILGADHVTRACELLERALVISPDDPLILAGYASALLRKLAFRPPTRDALDAAAVVAERAAELGPHLSETSVTLAHLRQQQLRLTDAARHARRALEIAPSSPDARLLVGRLLLEAALPSQALAHLRVARELGPDVALAWLDTVRTQALLGNWTHARTLALEPRVDHGWVYWILTFRLFGVWRRDEILGELRERFSQSAFAGDANLADLLSLFDSGDPRRAVTLTRRSLNVPTNTPANRAFGMQLAIEAYAHARWFDEALDELASAVALGFGDAFWIERCPVLDPLRANARFEELRAIVLARAAEITRVLT